MTLYDLQRLLYDVKMDDGLREHFLQGHVEEVARGYDLKAEEVALLKGSDSNALYHYGVNPVLVLFFGYLQKMKGKGPKEGKPPGGY